MLFYEMNAFTSNSLSRATFGKLTSSSDFYSLDGYIIGGADNMYNAIGLTKQNAFIVSLSNTFGTCNQKSGL